jgi:quinol monooxygenase YgiN
MGDVVGVVHVRAAQGKADEVVAAFTRCIQKTVEEPGCLSYALHRDAADPDHLVLLERWRSQGDLDAHMTQPHVAELLAFAGTPGMLSAPPELFFLSPITDGAESGGSA